MPIDASEVVNLVLASAPLPTVVLCPVVWKDGQPGSRSWYFILNAGANGASDYCDLLIECGSSQQDAEAARAQVHTSLIQHRCVLIDCDDELEAAKWSEKVWPGERSTRIRKLVENDRKRAPQ